MSVTTVDRDAVPRPETECPECENAVVMKIDDGQIHCPSGDCGVTWSKIYSLTWRKTGGR